MATASPSAYIGTPAGQMRGSTRIGGGGAARSVDQPVCEHHWQLTETRQEGNQVVFVWECRRCGEQVERSG